MIVFFAPYPLNEEEKKGGLCQRILSIDSLFFKQKRIYLTVSYSKYYKDVEEFNISEDLTVYRLNAFKHYLFIKNILKDANIIYMHTIGNALKFLPYLKNKKAVTICDMHGVVPEECDMFNRRLKSMFFDLVESITLSKIDYIICVTNNMVKHFETKYNEKTLESIVIPIFTRNRVHQKNNIDDNRLLTVIYAGGTQVWQNTEQMINLANTYADAFIRFSFWFPRNDFEKYSLTNNNEYILFSTGTNLEVIEHYNIASFGLILRDNNIVNNVACPTKIVEYLQYGLVPIVKSKEIGDFYKLGLEYITIEDFKRKDFNNINLKRNNNYKVLDSFYQQIDNGILGLEKIIGYELNKIKVESEK
ncbi:TPA: hypothetical protein ACX6RZ_002929 [Photobacterium damselae]